MSDFLVDLGENSAARKAVKTLGLPIPLPQKLDRNESPWTDNPLSGKTAIVAHPEGAQFAELVAAAIADAGAGCELLAGDAVAKVYKKSYTKSEGTLQLGAEADGFITPAPNALIFDASGLGRAADLKNLYNFFHPNVRSLAANGRVVILAASPEGEDDPGRAACMQSVNGFIRSLAREIGKKGATANLVYVDPGAEKAAVPVLQFILSNRSAYISAQPIKVSASIAPPAKITAVKSLDGKTALVTGSARGIGAKTATALAREGARVIGLDRPDEKEALASLMDRLGGEYILGDILEDGAPQAIAAEIKKRFGGLDIVVHNAGVTRDKTLGNMSEQLWDITLGVNLIALIDLNGQLEKMIKQNGRVICMASIAGIAGNMGQTNYAASKAGVIGYVRALAPKLVDKNISVNAIAPGFIETQMTAAIPFATREVARRLCNLSQGGQPEDIAELATFLAGPGSCGITGQTIRICGGNYIGA